MTIMNARRQCRMILRKQDTSFWDTLQRFYAGSDAELWRPLAMLVLRVDTGWTVEQIAMTFEITPGHVSRCLQRVKRDLRSRFQLPQDSPEWDSIDDEELGEAGERQP